ncbi:MAG: PLP-dependent aminotransferase family protein [Nitrosospira sp.]|nr:PLP-dependent aminotransferase family protein [Nitrosospira sp.]
MSTLYESLADALEALIDGGVYAAGSRMPSIRALSKQRNLSVTTCVNAYHELERRGRLESKPRAGFNVLARSPLSFVQPSTISVRNRPTPINTQQRIRRMLEAAGDPRVVNFGAANPHPSFLPGVSLERSYRQVLRSQRHRCLGQEFPPGAIELRTVITRRLAAFQVYTSPDELLITNGCQEAVTIALKLTTCPGDVVAIESPTYYGLLEVLRALGLRAIEIPANSEDGISIEALRLAATEWKVVALIIIANHSNPLGVTLSDRKKQSILALAEELDFSIVEDDVYGDLPIAGHRPRPLKAWDHNQRVYYCASATKTVSPGLRIGWLLPGRGDMQKAIHLQYVSTVSVQSVGQFVLTEYLARSHVDRQRRLMAKEFDLCRIRMLNEIANTFPKGTQVTNPQGGFVIWVELPHDADTVETMARALQDGIAFAPGTLFSVNKRFKNCLRLNAAMKWSDRTRNALGQLSEYFR